MVSMLDIALAVLIILIIGLLVLREGKHEE